MKTNLKEIQDLVLSLAVEDYFGLYEIIWSMNNEWPDLEEPKKINLARDAVKNLLQDELIQLYIIEIQAKEPVLVSSEEVYKLVENSKKWQPGNPYIGFAATDKGEEFYYSTYKA